MNPRFGAQPDLLRRYSPRPGGYAVINAGDTILATWTRELQLPGGGVDPGESPLQALYREVLEETGYRIHSPRRLGMFHRFAYLPDYGFWAQKQCHIYLANLGRCMGPPQEPNHEAVFLDWQVAAQHLAVEGDRHFLRLAHRKLGR